MSKRQDPSQAVSRTAALLLRPLHMGLGLWSRGGAFARRRENALLAARVLPASRLEGPGVGHWLRRGRGAGRRDPGVVGILMFKFPGRLTDCGFRGGSAGPSTVTSAFRVAN